MPLSPRAMLPLVTESCRRHAREHAHASAHRSSTPQPKQAGVAARRRDASTCASMMHARLHPCARLLWSVFYPSAVHRSGRDPGVRTLHARPSLPRSDPTMTRVYTSAMTPQSAMTHAPVCHDARPSRPLINPTMCPFIHPASWTRLISRPFGSSPLTHSLPLSPPPSLPPSPRPSLPPSLSPSLSLLRPLSSPPLSSLFPFGTRARAKGVAGDAPHISTI
jgi:hypothetical protein